MTNEQKIRKIVSRFSGLDYFMLYLIVKWFADSGDELPSINPTPKKELQNRINEIYEESEYETQKLVKESYVSGYKSDKDRDKKTFALLAGAILLSGGEIAMNPQGYKAFENTQRVMKNATALLPFQFQQAQMRAVNWAVDIYNQGGITWQQAKQKALNMLADQGVAHFVDRANRHWDADAYVEMGIRTGTANAARAGFIDSMIARGKDLVYPSAHRGCCPKCAPWEGVVLSISGDDPNHPSLQDAIDSGLFHPNCKHRLLEYIEGYSKLISYNSPENDQLYKDMQRQRTMERYVRQWKRREITALTAQEKARAKSYTQKWQSELRQFTQEKGLARKYYREAA